MAQTWTDNCFDPAHQGRVDLQAFEDNFAALKSMFSGADAPADPVPGMTWFHTTKKLPKMRNNANNDWLGIMAADASHKIWIYRNTAPDGWAIDSSVYDVVLALKGGTNAYNANGGTIAGTWTQPGHVHSMAHTHGGATGAGGSHSHNRQSQYGGGFAGEGNPDLGGITTTENPHTHAISSESGNTANGATVSTYRPAAAVGTLQYMDI